MKCVEIEDEGGRWAWKERNCVGDAWKREIFAEGLAWR